MMVGGPALKHLGADTAQPPRHAAVETEGDDVACDMRRLARADILEPFQLDRADGIVIADDRGPSFKCARNPQQLQTVEDLTVRQMNIRQRDVADP